MLTDLLLAVRRGDNQEVIRILDTESIEDINARLDEGLLANQSALELATIGTYNNLELIQTLIDRGASFDNVNHENVINMITGVWYNESAQISKLKMIKIMIENGFPLNAFRQVLAEEQLNSYQDIIIYLRNNEGFNVAPELTPEEFINMVNDFTPNSPIVFLPVLDALAITPNTTQHTDSEAASIQTTQSTLIDSQVSGASSVFTSQDH